MGGPPGRSGEPPGRSVENVDWVFMGFYNLLDSKTLLIGFLFAYKNHLRKITF